MAYIGNIPAESYSAFQKQDFTTSATTSYTLDHPVANQNELALFINFVRQEPTAAYTASGTSLSLTSATSVGDDMYCVYLGKAVIADIVLLFGLIIAIYTPINAWISSSSNPKSFSFCLPDAFLVSSAV